MAEPAPSVYRRRVVDDELDALLEELPAISLEGPRAVGLGQGNDAVGRRLVRIVAPTPAVDDPSADGSASLEVFH